MTYDVAHDVTQTTKHKGSMRYGQPKAEPAPVPISASQASPFFDDTADAIRKKPEKRAKVHSQEDAYTQLVFPPRTVVTATREIPRAQPEWPTGSERRTAARPPVRMRVAQPKAQAKSNKDQQTARLNPQRSKKAETKCLSLLAVLLQKKRQTQAASKRTVVLADARAQRRKRNILATLGIMAVIATGVVLSLTVLFRIESIEVEGDSPYAAQDILSAFDRKVGDNLLAFRAQPAATAMQMKLPYLETIDIHRVLPAKIRIEVTRALEAYSVSSVSGWVVLSDTLRVLRIDPQPPEGLPPITGAEAIMPVLGTALVLEDTAKLVALQALLAQTSKQQLLPATEINLADALNMSFVYAGRIRIVLGTQNDLEKKIEWAKYLVTPSGEDSLPETERGTLDVSNRNAEGRIKAVWRAGVL